MTTRKYSLLMFSMTIAMLSQYALAQSVTHNVAHVFTIEDVQGSFDGSTVGIAGTNRDPSID